jgi:hypothetical protein
VDLQANEKSRYGAVQAACLYNHPHGRSSLRDQRDHHTDFQKKPGLEDGMLKQTLNSKSIDASPVLLQQA